MGLPIAIGLPEESKDFAAEAATMPRDEIADDLDEYEHFGNRRLRTVGELIQEAFRIGLYRMERVVRERMTTEDVDTITPQTIINIRPVVAALKEFFGSSQLSQFMDQTNSLAGPHPPPAPLGARRRRPHPRARAHRGARRAPDPLRAHVPDRDAGGPEHRPDRLAAALRDRERVRLHPDALPPGQGRHGDRRDRAARRHAGGAQVIAQANAELDAKTGKLVGQVLCRKGGEPILADPADVELMDVSPEQIGSVATALIPFLEHDDANRALMGSNMQRQAVPLMSTEAPLVGTGIERRAAVDTGDVVIAAATGTVAAVDADHDHRRGPPGEPSTTSCTSSCAPTRAR